MDRFDAVPRSERTRHQGHPTWDIFHVWQNDTIRHGVRFTSTLHVYVAEPGHPDARVGIWVPNGEGGEPQHLIPWGFDFWVPITGWGVISVVSFNDVPLKVFWELSAGKAPDVRSVSDTVPPPVLDRIPQPANSFDNFPTFNTDPPPPFHANRPSVRAPGIDD